MSTDRAFFVSGQFHIFDSMRKEKCPYCQKEVSYKQINHHVQTCFKNPEVYNYPEIVQIDSLESDVAVKLSKESDHYKAFQKISFRCKDCGKEVVTYFQTLEHARHQFCCVPCSQKRTNLERYGVANAALIPSSKEKRKQTSLKKYGCESPTQNREVKAKLWANRSQEAFSKKMKEVWENKTEEQRETQRLHVSQTHQSFSEEKKQQIQEKHKQTCLEKYGVDSYQRSEAFRKDLPRRIKLSCKRCTYEGVHFDSSWELALWIYAQDHNLEIEKEPCSFEYIFEGKKHIYFPDFRFQGKLLELKGNHFYRGNYASSRTQYKVDVVAKEHGVEVWYRDDTLPYLEYMVQKEGKGWYKKYKNK